MSRMYFSYVTLVLRRIPASLPKYISYQIFTINFQNIIKMRYIFTLWCDHQRQTLCTLESIVCLHFKNKSFNLNKYVL